MFLFPSSQINSVISSFERFRDQSKLYAQAQIKAFNGLNNWAADSGNTAIQDVSSKLADLFANGDLSQDKNYSLKDTVQMFKRFKEIDTKNQQLRMRMRVTERLEKKSLFEIEKCPSYKNIRDLELKYKKAQADRAAAEMEYYNSSKESDASKVILFKTHLKRLNEELLRQNEAERVLLTAMSDLIKQIPDVSSAPEEDQNDINYANFDKTDKICVKARKQISRLSLNPPLAAATDVEEPSEAEEDEPIAVATEVPKETPKETGARKRRVRVSCPPNMTIPPLAEEKSAAAVAAVRPSGLYPRLETLEISSSSDWTEVSTICQPPPTYSDSESMSSVGVPPKPSRFLPSYRRVAPSAPAYEDVTEQDRLQKSKPAASKEPAAILA